MTRPQRSSTPPHMHHIAIMKKSWNLIPKILSGEKSIESRWYKTRRAPWNKVHKGDVIFFKNAGEPVIARATVSQVLQFTLSSVEEVREVIANYGDKLCLVNKDPTAWESLPHYCILMFLEHPEEVKSFKINKEGFGSASAWLTVKDVETIKIK